MKKMILKKGFTVVELLIAVALIGILSVVVFSLAINQTSRARDSQKLENIKQIRNALDVYYNDNNCYPNTISTPYPAKSFQDALATGGEWKVPDTPTGTVYMKKVPTPSAGSSFIYISDPSSVQCPQWGIIYAKLSKPSSLPVCNIPQYAKEGAGSAACKPADFDTSSYGCVSVGTVTCNQPSQTPYTPDPTPVSVPVLTPTQPAGGMILVEDADHDGYYIGGPGPQVIDPTPQTFNGRSYFKKLGGTQYIYVVQGSVTAGDCNDSSPNVYRNLENMAIDADRDGFYGTSADVRCVGVAQATNVAVGTAGSYAMNEGTGTTLADTSGYNNSAKFGPMYGLAGYWLFNQAGGADLSGNSNNMGFAPGAPTYVWGPRITATSTSATAFNGLNNYAAVNNHTTLNPTKQVTISGWFVPNYLNKPYQAIFSKESSSCSTINCAGIQYAMWFDQKGSLIASSTSQNNVGVGATVCAGPVAAVQYGKWSYVSLVINTVAGSINIYHNGQLYASCPYATGTTIFTSTGSLLFGANQVWDSFFYGNLSDFKVFNRALSAYEIQQSYSTTTGGLVGYWQFDENSGKLAKDSSGYALDGVIQNNLLGRWLFDEGVGPTGYDTSGNNNNATSTSPWFGGATLYFNGAQNATVGGTSTLAGDAPWTFSTWVYAVANPTPAQVWSTIIELGNTCTRNLIIYRDSNGAYRGGFRNGTQFNMGTTPLNQWAYLTVTYTGNLGTIQAYYNGNPATPVTVAAGANGTGDAGSGTLASDNAACGATHGFNGYLLNTQIYNRALSQAEVSNLYIYGFPNNPNWLMPGRIGSSALNSNSSTVAYGGTYVNLGTPTQLNLNGEMSAFAWVYPRNVSALGGIVGQSNDAGLGGLFNFNLGRTAGKLEANWGGIVLPNNSSNATLANNGWYHVGFVRSGSAGNWTGKIYVNGVLDKTFTTATNPGTQQNTVIAGLSYAYPQYSFNGYIDDVQLYNRALTQPEISAIAANGGNPYWAPDRLGTAGRALGFNGNNGFAGIGSPVTPGLPTITNITGNLTINAWVHPFPPAATNRAIATWGNTYTTMPYHFVITPSNTLRLNNGNPVTAIYDSINTVPLNTWSNVALSISGNELRFYINGVADSANPQLITSRTAGDAYLTISREASGLQTFSGFMDDLKIYNAALSAADIQNMYNNLPVTRPYYMDSAGTFTNVLNTDVFGGPDSADNNPAVH